jgi:hypothetical protein
MIQIDKFGGLLIQVFFLLSIICMIQVEELIEKFGGLLSCIHWRMGICITGQLMIFF